MITARNAGTRAGRFWLLQDISLDLAPGSFTAVLGPNGAGKTTLLSLLAGDRAPDAGTVLLDGTPLSAVPPRILSRRRAVLAQDHTLEFALTVEDIVALGRLPHQGTPAARHDQAALDAARADFALDTLWRRPFPTLSGGERQRAHLARAAAQLWRPEPGRDGTLLLLDEPAAALDLAQQRRALGFATDMAARGAIVLAVLHDPNQAIHASQVAMLRGGILLAAGPPATVLTGPRLSECYATLVEAIARPDRPPVFLAASP